MKEYIYLFGLVCISMVSFPCDVFALFKPTKFTVVVVSEEGEPLSGIKVGVGFEKNTGWGTDSSGQQSITGADGRLEFSGQSNGHVTFGGTKEGYYPSYYGFDFKDLSTVGWEPWNPELTIVMRKIENPVPMYARNTKMSRKRVEIPVVGKDVGFDLIAYDWVPPYGNGKYSDFIFHLKSKFSGNRDYDFTLTLKFDNGNGLQSYKEDLNQGSLFKLPRFAPEDGYMNTLEIYTRHIPGGQLNRTLDENKHYIFRVRALVDDDNRVKSALYQAVEKQFVQAPDFTRNGALILL